jgi:Nuclease-related domain
VVRSEQLIDGALEPLRIEDWDIHTNVAWPGSGDLDVVAIAPGGPTFVIETKTRRYTIEHVLRTARAARLFTAGIPILVTAAPGKLRIEDGVNVCGRDRLVPFLRACTADYHRRLAEAMRHRAPA